MTFKCPFCKKTRLVVRKRTYTMSKSVVGTITSVKPMCGKCFKLVKNNPNLI